MWDTETALARQAAQEAGKILLESFGNTTTVAMKGDIDLVTEADIRSERFILDLIIRHFPRDSILTEETGAHNHDPRRLWIVDPLDGTINYAHGFPFFAVSIALQVEGELMLGVVLNPFLGECFQATRGSGAYLNGNPIRVSRARTLQESLLATGFPYTVHQNPHHVMHHLERLLVRAQGIRRPGSAAMDLCYVAAGRLDGFWEEGLKPWDTAAGVVILQEAGGRMSTYGGKPYTPFEKDLVASNPFIHEAMLSAFSG